MRAKAIMSSLFLETKRKHHTEFSPKNKRYPKLIGSVFYHNILPRKMKVSRKTDTCAASEEQIVIAPLVNADPKASENTMGNDE